MQKAIDNYARGKQREVLAWAGSRVSASTGRFICPECLEVVALDVRGYFRHKNRTPQSIECDKRVDSPSRSAHERMGLPLYLCNESDGHFYLGIGFSGHDDLSLQKATSSQAYFEIENSNQKPTRYNISYARFLPNTTTILPINYLPRNNGAFRIKYSSNTPPKLKNLWTDHSDVWGTGQFFKISEQKSRKIRPLGTLVTDEDYYYIGNTYFLSNYRSFVSVSQVGVLSLRTQNLSVYKIHIAKNKASEYQFRSFADLLRNYYKINLLVGESLLAPVWPPCIDEDNRMIYPINTSTAHLFVQTPNDAPVLYRYFGGNYVLDEISGKAPYTSCITLTNEDIPICVDRAFNGNIQFICRSNIKQASHKLSADIVDESGASVRESAPTALRGKIFRCVTNFPAMVHIFNGEKKDLCREITDNDGLLLENCQWNDTICIFTRNGSLVYQYSFQKKVVSGHAIHESIDLTLLNASLAGPSERITLKVLALYKNTTDSTIKSILGKYIRQGSIPCRLVSLLLRNYRRKA